MTKKPTPPVNALEIFVAAELKKFEFTAEDLQKAADLYKDLTIIDLSDKEGFTRVHEARMDLKNTRVAIEKTGKALRASANAFNKSVLARESELVNIIAPAEGRLTEKESMYEKWKEEERMAAERQEAARLDERIKKLRAVGADHDIVALKLMPDESFADILDEATTAFIERRDREVEEEKARKAEEERKENERKVEAERLKKVAMEQAAENERLQKLRDEQEAHQRELKLQQDELIEMRAKLAQQQKDHEAKLAAEAAEKKRQEELEIARKEGEGKAKREADELKQRQQQQDFLKEQAEKLRIAQVTAERPEKEKIKMLAADLAAFVIANITPVVFKTAKYKALQQTAIEMLDDVVGLLYEKKK